MQPTVVILGGGFSGIGTAHKLLKHTKPKVPTLRIILVSRSTHHYWNIASVRGVLPGAISDDCLFYDINSGFQKYPSDSFELIIGSVSGIDLNQECVAIQTSDGPKSIPYTELVIATGSSYPSRLPFTSIGTYDDTRNELHQLQHKIEAASSILIAGSGATGVETAAELASAYNSSKDITLVVEGQAPLLMLRMDIREAAARGLEALGVKLVANARVQTSTQSRSKMHTHLSNGDSHETHLYLPLFGTRPNTIFVPQNLLDDRGYVKLERTLRAEGFTNIWGVGDVGNLESNQLIYAESQTQHLAKNLDAVLIGRPDQVTDLKLGYSPQIFVTLGKKKGVGQFLNFQVPSFVVSTVKGKTLFTEKGPGMISGKNIVRSAI
ncbi:Ff.00g010970.m01.CDS01 [Fusarium sp. VM40]|nr:Ff.00g010970.m01.CDS01 [Fusarium sp. VM40]